MSQNIHKMLLTLDHEIKRPYQEKAEKCIHTEAGILSELF